MNREVAYHYRLTTYDDEILTTEEHPFWRQGEGWVEAQHLKVGNAIAVAEGDLLVRQIERVDQPLKVYNFTVEGDHTYFVGPYGLWVHNANDVCDLAGKISDNKTPNIKLLESRKGTLKGEPEVPHRNDNADMVRSLMRQNESAELLSNKGLNVTHLPNKGKKGGNPDLDIDGRPADVYSPESKNPKTIWDNINYKVKHQAPDIVLNLDDSPFVPDDMVKYFQGWPVDGLERLYLVKGDRVVLWEL